MTKFLSRKFITMCGIAIIDVLSLFNVIPPEQAQGKITLINGIGAVYIAVEGVIDAIGKMKNGI